MQIFFLNGLWRLLKNGHLPVKLHSSAPPPRDLRRVRKIREADPERAIVYTDETWLNQGHRTKKERVDLEALKEKNLRSLHLSGLTVGCTEEMTGKGGRLIISDAMTETGPVRGGFVDV